MATLAQLQEAYANPNVRKMLDLIASSEGSKYGYNTLFGNQQFSNLSAHPNIKKEFKQTDGTTKYTTAAGRYQFLNSTWNNIAKQYGFRDFSPKAQDLGAIALIAGRGALNDVMNGNYKAAIQKLGKEWASLPTSQYAQGKRSWDFVNNQLGQNVGDGFSPEFVPKSMLVKSQQQYQPEFVPKEAIPQSYQPEFVQDDPQPKEYQPELVPTELLAKEHQDMPLQEPVAQQQANLQQNPVEQNNQFKPEFVPNSMLAQS
ncbi:glycoside hydrolase family 24 protein [Acinetobacter sp. ANC 4636]